MLSFRALSEKKTKIKINPKQSEITEMEKNHGEDCDCMKCEKKRRKEGGEKEVATEAKYYDPMEDPDFDHDEAEATRGQSGKHAKKKKTTKKEDVAYDSQEEVSEESNQSIAETETLLTFGQFREGMSLKQAAMGEEVGLDEGIRSTIAAAGLSAAVAAHGGIGKKAETHKSPAPEKSQATQVSKKKETKSPEQIWREKHPNLAAKEDSKKKPASVKSQLSDIGDMIARSKARQQNNSFEPKGELVDERTRYAKETGKDFQTGKPSEKGGTLGGDDRHSKVMRHMQKDLRKSGGLMSSRGKPIKPQGKKKDKGAKPSFKMEPTSVDKIKAKLAQKRKPKPDISSRFD